MEMKPIPEYEDEYAIGVDCTVYRLLNRRNNSNKPYSAPKPITTRKDVNGYWVVSLCRNGKVSTRRVSRLMLMAFVGLPPSKYHQAAHLDGDKDNNTIDNLKWVLIEENESHKKLHGTVAKGEKNGAAKLTDEQVSEIRRRAASGESRKVLAAEFNTSRGNIQSIVNGKTRVETEVFYKNLYLEAVAREAKLREALDAVQQVANGSEGIAGWHMNGDIASWDSILPEVEQALALPADDTALREMIEKAGEVMRERCAKFVKQNIYSNQTDIEAIRALPGVTLENLQ